MPKLWGDTLDARGARTIAKSRFGKLSALEPEPFPCCFCDKNRHKIDNAVAEMLGLDPGDSDIQAMLPHAVCQRAQRQWQAEEGTVGADDVRLVEEWENVFVFCDWRNTRIRALGGHINGVAILAAIRPCGIGFLDNRRGWDHGSCMVCSTVVQAIARYHPMNGFGNSAYAPDRPLAPPPHHIIQQRLQRVARGGWRERSEGGFRRFAAAGRLGVGGGDYGGGARRLHRLR